MSRPRLVLISGWAYPSSAWGDTAAFLAPDWDLSIIDPRDVLDAHDSRDHGVAGRIRAAVASRAPCIFGGWSLGGMLALEHAGSMASLVDGLLVLSSASRFCAAPDYAFGVPPSELRAMQIGIRRNRSETLGRFYARSARPAAPPPRSAEWADETRGHDLRSGLVYLANVDLRARSGPEGLPTVVLHGDEDAVIPSGAATELAARLHCCHLDIIPGAGHDFPLRLPRKIKDGLDHIGSSSA